MSGKRLLSVSKTRLRNAMTEVIKVINTPKHKKKNPALNLDFACVSIQKSIPYLKVNNKHKKVDKKFENFSKKLTRWIGSPQSIIIHTIFFIVMFSLRFFNISSSDVLLILTTVVSLEAIYLAIFIQMTVNRQARELEEVSEDIEEIQEDVGEIQKDVEEIQEDVEDIQEEVKD